MTQLFDILMPAVVGCILIVLTLGMTYIVGIFTFLSFSPFDFSENYRLSGAIASFCVSGITWIVMISNKRD